MPRRFILLILLLNYALSAIAQYDEIRRPTTECPDNQITQVYDNQIICVNRETGACTGLAWECARQGHVHPVVTTTMKALRLTKTVVNQAKYPWN